MLAEMRKYRVGLTMAHQYLAQLDDRVRDAILGNAGTTIAFRIGLPDARVLADQFHDAFAVHDLVNLPNHGICVRLMTDGNVTRPFTADTLPVNRE